MCGKFTALASWRAANSPESASTIAAGEDDRLVTYRVMGNLLVIVWDRETGQRRVLPMRWGFPHPQDWRRPQPIHARSETIETTLAFASAFLDGQRGIVLMKTFNESPDIEGPTLQHTITPGDEQMLAAAFVWRRFDVGATESMLACCLVTVPANRLIATLPTDRMPAFLAAEDWDIWLGERPASVDALKSCLKSVEDARWSMSQEERKENSKRRKPVNSDPGDLV